MKLCFKSFLILVFSASFMITAYADNGVILEEGFDGYINDAALDKEWVRVGNAMSYLTVDPATVQNKVLFSKGDRRMRVFPSVTPTNEEPLKLQFDYFDYYRQNVSGREYVGLLAGPKDATSLIEVGLHNVDGSMSLEHYTARIFGSTYGTDWFELKTPRSEKWHRIELLIFQDTVEIYFDGDLDTVVEWEGGTFSVVRLGFGVGASESASLTPVLYDNLKIEKINPPAAQGTVIELLSRIEVAPEDPLHSQGPP